MNQALARDGHMDLITVVALAAIAISLTVGLHEGVHAATCSLIGGSLKEYSALHVDCVTTILAQQKVVAASASLFNLLLGTILWLLLDRRKPQSGVTLYFLWVYMLMNWLYGAGYWMFSGIVNVGDWAIVMDGWQPHWVWRVVLTIVGTACYALVVMMALRLFGQFLGGKPAGQVRRATKLGLISYGTAAVVVLIAGIFNPYGLTGLPVVAGLLAVLGGLSPLVWMMQWYRATMFEKLSGPALTITRSWAWIVAAIVITSVYCFVLGPTLYF